jgi:hypothetical protein
MRTVCPWVADHPRSPCSSGVLPFVSTRRFDPQVGKGFVARSSWTVHESRSDRPRESVGPSANRSDCSRGQAGPSVVAVNLLEVLFAFTDRPLRGRRLSARLTDCPSYTQGLFAQSLADFGMTFDSCLVLLLFDSWLISRTRRFVCA